MTISKILMFVKFVKSPAQWKIYDFNIFYQSYYQSYYAQTVQKPKCLVLLIIHGIGPYSFNYEHNEHNS